MTERKIPGIGYVVGAVLGTIAVGLAVFGLGKVMPKMMKKCLEKMEQKGFEPPALCKKIMEKCCGGPAEEAGEEPKEKRKKKKRK